MIGSFLITFREVLEAALLVGIILGYLSRTKQFQYFHIVYLGVASGIVGSIIGAVLFERFAGGFEGRSEEIFEGLTMLLGASLLTSMIFWMMKQRHVGKEIEQKVERHIAESRKVSLFLLVFFSILREGIETVIFLEAASFLSTDRNLWGALAGIVAALILGYAIFVASIKVPLKKFFHVTSVLLILFAAGLLAHGVHELEEAKIFPQTIEHVWDFNPAVLSDGSYPLFHEQGFIGSLLTGLFGYNANPSLLEVLVYLAYIAAVCILWKGIERKSLSPSL